MIDTLRLVCGSVAGAWFIIAGLIAFSALRVLSSGPSAQREDWFERRFGDSK